MIVTEISNLITELRANMEQVVLGKPEVVRRAVETLIAGGHLLMEDIPGVGKTTLANALARSVDASFRRIQFTSDLLPGDILGASVPEMIKYWSNLESALKNVAAGRQGVDEALDGAAQRTVQ